MRFLSALLIAVGMIVSALILSQGVRADIGSVKMYAGICRIHNGGIAWVEDGKTNSLWIADDTLYCRLNGTNYPVYEPSE